MARKASSKPADSSAHLGFEAKLWLSADKLRKNMDAAEPSGARQTAASSPKGERGGANQYKHVVLGLIFLKYISDTFDEHHGKLVAGKGDSFRRDLHPDLRADYVLANPPFNDSDTALRGSALLQTGGKLKVMTERQDNFRFTSGPRAWRVCLWISALVAAGRFRRPRHLSFNARGKARRLGFPFHR